MTANKKTHHVFWTGGLDSSFRVLYLLMTTDDLVQAHYIIRHEESTGNEINAMNNIRRAVGERSPDLRKRFLPTRYASEDLILKSKEVDEEIEKLRKIVRIHEQYQILAHYCNEFNVKEVDLTYERDRDSTNEKHNVESYFGNTFPFESFRNPHHDLTKMDYYKLAKEKGWSDLLNLTSFCRRPKKNNKPCGLCGPCTDAVKNGVGFRLPFSSRIKSRIILPFRIYYRNNYHKHDKTWLFKMVKRRFEHKF